MEVPPKVGSGYPFGGHFKYFLLRNSNAPQRAKLPCFYPINKRANRRRNLKAFKLLNIIVCSRFFFKICPWNS